MPVGLIAGAVGSAVLGGIASKKAANAQVSASNSAIAEQQRQYDQTRADQAPFRQAGYNALANLQNPAAAFQASPGYDFRRTEGMRDLNNSFAARGGALSGNALRALSQYNQNLASNEYGNWWNQQAGLAGAGQASVNQTGVLGQAKAANVGNSLMNAGNARASGIMGTADALSGLTSDLIGLNQLGLIGRKRPQPYSSQPYYQNPNQGW